MARWAVVQTVATRDCGAAPQKHDLPVTRLEDGLDAESIRQEGSTIAVKALTVGLEGRAPLHGQPVRAHVILVGCQPEIDIDGTICPSYRCEPKL